MTLRINIDSDSVVYDLNTILLDRARQRWGQHLDTPRAWNASEQWGVTDDDLHELFVSESINRLYADGWPIKGAVSALTQLAEAGHDLRIVTHKHGMGAGKVQAMSDMIGWYEEQGLLDIVDIVFARGDKTEYPADVVIDDKPTLAWAQKGAVNILFDQPWNYSVKRAKGVLRANDWPSVLSAINYFTGESV